MVPPDAVGYTPCRITDFVPPELPAGALRRCSRPSESTKARTGAYVSSGSDAVAACAVSRPTGFLFLRFFLFSRPSSLTISLSDSIDILHRLTIRRNAIPVFPNSPFARVVSSDRQAWILWEQRSEILQITDTAIDVLFDVEANSALRIAVRFPASTALSPARLSAIQHTGL